MGIRDITAEEAAEVTRIVREIEEHPSAAFIFHHIVLELRENPAYLTWVVSRHIGVAVDLAQRKIDSIEAEMAYMTSVLVLIRALKRAGLPYINFEVVETFMEEERAISPEEMEAYFRGYPELMSLMDYLRDRLVALERAMNLPWGILAGPFVVFAVDSLELIRAQQEVERLRRLW